jgi:hypothetical protein
MRLHPGAGAIISWEPNCSPEVTIAITTSQEPPEEPETR